MKPKHRYLDTKIYFPIKSAVIIDGVMLAHGIDTHLDLRGVDWTDATMEMVGDIFNVTSGDRSCIVRGDKMFVSDNPIKFSEGAAVIKKGAGTWDDKVYSYVSDDMKPMFGSRKFIEAKPFSEGAALVSDSTFSFSGSTEYKFIDKDGNQLFGKTFLKAHSFSEGVAAVEYKGQWIYIDRKGENIFGDKKFYKASPFVDGHAVVGEEYEGHYATYAMDKNGNVLFNGENVSDIVPEDRYIWFVQIHNPDAHTRRWRMLDTRHWKYLHDGEDFFSFTWYTTSHKERFIMAEREDERFMIFDKWGNQFTEEIFDSMKEAEDMCDDFVIE